MGKPATQIAAALLAKAADENEMIDDDQFIRIFQFGNDVAAHERDLLGRVTAEFHTAFSDVQQELTTIYGNPVRTGSEEDPAIPLNGVFRCAFWAVEGKLLFLAAAHEDRECPFFLMLGVSP
jgi:hypothetical protein